MRLQIRLFLVFAGLLLLSLGAALWGVRLLTRELSVALDQAVFSVGHAVIEVFDERLGAPAAAPGDPPPRSERIERRVIVHARHGEAAAGPLPGLADAPQQQVRRFYKLELDAPAGALKLVGADGQPRLIQVPRSGVSAALQGFSQQLLGGAAVLFGLGLLLAFLLARRIARPLRALAEAAGRIGGGELGHTLQPVGMPEVRATIETFNRMSGQLAALAAERTRLQALAALSELGEVGRGLAHSLRNPLNTLGLVVDSVPEGATPEVLAMAKQRAREQIRRIDQALRSFLALAADGSAGSAVDVSLLVEDLLLEASQRAAGRVTLALALPAEPLQLVVQPQDLRAALQAPLVNALEASPDGATIEVELSAPAPGRARLRIADRGAGVPAALRARLFEPHQSSKPDGAGMGLFLAARILRQRYGGSLELHDRDGGGTEVLAEFGARRHA